MEVCADTCSFMTMRVDDEVYISKLSPLEKGTKYFSIFIILLLTHLDWKSITNLLWLLLETHKSAQLCITTCLLTTRHVAIKCTKLCICSNGGGGIFLTWPALTISSYLLVYNLQKATNIWSKPKMNQAPEFKLLWPTNNIIPLK